MSKESAIAENLAMEYLECENKLRVIRNTLHRFGYEFVLWNTKQQIQIDLIKGQYTSRHAIDIKDSEK